MTETHVPPSFIPQDTAVPYAHRRRGSSGFNELLLLAAIVLLVASLALGAGVFVYQQYLVAESASKSANLNRAKDAFDPSLIHELTRLDDRMKAADRILSAHSAPTAFFAALQQTTLKTISFRTLNLNIADQKHVTVQMAGVAQSVNSIALQADIFSTSGIINGPIFSNIARDRDGVRFNLVATVNLESINYSSLISGGPSTVPQNAISPQGLIPSAEPSPFSGPTTAPGGGQSPSTKQ